MSRLSAAEFERDRLSFLDQLLGDETDRCPACGLHVAERVAHRCDPVIIDPSHSTPAPGHGNPPRSRIGGAGVLWALALVGLVHDAVSTLLDRIALRFAGRIVPDSAFTERHPANVRPRSLP